MFQRILEYSACALISFSTVLVTNLEFCVKQHKGCFILSRSFLLLLIDWLMYELFNQLLNI